MTTDDSDILDRQQWITVQEAMQATQRSRPTIFRWLKDPDINIRTWRPRRHLYLFKPDVMAAETKATAAIGKKKTRGNRETPTAA